MEKMEKISENRKKGLVIATNMLVILIIAILVVVVIAFYFSGVFTVSMSEAEAQRAFRDGCMRYCEADTFETYVNAYNAVSINTLEDAKFLAACERLGYGTRIGHAGNAYDYPNRCLEFCGRNFCNMDTSKQETDGIHNQIIESLQT